MGFFKKKHNKSTFANNLNEKEGRQQKSSVSLHIKLSERSDNKIYTLFLINREMGKI